MKWSVDLVLGYTPMDHVHEAFVELLARLEEAADDRLPELLRMMEDHLGQHFSQENAWMEQTLFPARACHIGEHEAVLKSVAEVRVLLSQGNTSLCRDLVRALAEWFPRHTTHLDSALAHWMCRQRLGGKPLVFKGVRAASSGRRP